MIWKYAQADFERANEILSYANVDEYIDNSMDQAWSKWEENFMNQCIPTMTVELKSSPPWLSHDILKAIRS